MQINEVVGDKNTRTFSIVIRPQVGERQRLRHIRLSESLADDDSRWVVSRFCNAQDAAFRWHTHGLEQTSFNNEEEAMALFQSLVAEAQGGSQPRLEVMRRPVGVADDRDIAAYIRCHLQLLAMRETKHYRCLTVTDAVYRRLDRQPLTETDIRVLRGLRWGQIHNVGVAADGLKANVHSQCDSGD
jgi:hypothetical protein